MKFIRTRNGFRLVSTKPGDGLRLLAFVEGLAKPAKKSKARATPSQREEPTK